MEEREKGREGGRERVAIDAQRVFRSTQATIAMFYGVEDKVGLASSWKNNAM